MIESIQVTGELKEALEFYKAMKDIRRIAFTAYCDNQTPKNAAAHESAGNAVQDGANQIANLIERMVVV